MKLVTWNVNSLNVRLPRSSAGSRRTRPTSSACRRRSSRCEVPHIDIEAAGYKAHTLGQRTYNGVAILVREGLVAENVTMGLPEFEDQRRLIAATVDGVRVVCAYVPNGQSVGSDKYAYKLAWCSAVTAALRDALSEYPSSRSRRHEHRPGAQGCARSGGVAGQRAVLAAGAAVFREWLDAGFTDSFRMFDQPPNSFSWWDYRMLAFPKNRGLRIDHILLSRQLAKRCTSCVIDRNARKGERPSDHAPVTVQLASAN